MINRRGDAITNSDSRELYLGGNSLSLFVHSNVGLGLLVKSPRSTYRVSCSMRIALGGKFDNLTTRAAGMDVGYKDVTSVALPRSHSSPYVTNSCRETAQGGEPP